MRIYLIMIIIGGFFFVSCEDLSDMAGEMAGSEESELSHYDKEKVEDLLSEVSDDTTGAGLTIPDGYDIDKEDIVLGVGEAIATPDTAILLGIDGFIFPAGQAIGFGIENHPELDFTKTSDFKIKLPITDSTWALYSAPQIVVVYHVETQEDSKNYRIGIVFREDLVVSDSYVEVSAKGSGLYQVGYLEGEIPEKVEITTEEEPPEFDITEILSNEYSGSDSDSDSDSYSEPPVPLLSLTQLGGGEVLGMIKLELQFPTGDDFDYYDHVIIRSETGSTPPDCQTGNIARYISKEELGYASQTQEYDVYAGEPGKPAAFRACIYNSDNGFNDSNTSVNGAVKSKPYLVFATSTLTNGDLGGLAGADAYCESAAKNGSAPSLIQMEREWKAILSTTSVNVKDRVYTNEEVFMYDNADPSNLVRVVSSTTGSYLFGGGGIINVIDKDEMGLFSAVNHDIWTGTDTSGNGGISDCSGWTDPSSGMGYYGIENGTTSDWLYSGGGLSDTCGNPKRIYCVSTYGILDFTASTVDQPDGKIEIHMHAPDTTHYTFDKIKIRRLAGTTPPMADCSNGDVVDADITTFDGGCYSFIDSLLPGNTYSYRACVLNGSEILDSDEVTITTEGV